MHLARFGTQIRFAMTVATLSLLGACSSTGVDRIMPMAPGSVAEDASEAKAAKGLRLIRMAESAERSGDYGTALGLYQQLASRNPESDAVFYGLGNILLKTGEPRGSADAFAKILQRKPGDRIASIGYARAMMTLGRPEAAAAHIEPLFEKHPDDLRILNLLAVIRDLQADHDGAMALYRRGLFQDPESVMLRNNMALSAALSGNYEGGVELMKPVVEGLQSTRQTRQNYALILGLGGDFAEAERISRIDLDSAATANNLAYFAALRAMEPSQIRSAVLRPTAKAMSPVTSREQTENLVVGISMDGDAISLASTPNDSWFVQLGKFASAEAASGFWSDLRNSEHGLFGNLRPLADSGQGTQQLTIGPVSGRSEAQMLCQAIKSKAPDCHPIEL